MINNFEELASMIASGKRMVANIVPVIGEGDEEILLNDDNIESEMPVLPVMEQVLLPGVIIPIAARRAASRRLLADITTPNRHILVFTQRNDCEEPTELDLYPVGVVAKVLKVFNFRDDIMVAILQGVTRCHSLMVSTHTPYMMGSVTLAPESTAGMDTIPFKRKMKLLRTSYREVMKIRMQDDELASMLDGIGSDRIFINFASTHMDVETNMKYELLACESYRARVDRLLADLNTLKGLEELRREIDDKTRDSIDTQQREYYLRHQLDVIQEELGGMPGGYVNTDAEELRTKAKDKKWPKQVADTFAKELAKFAKMAPMSSDYNVQQNYLETLVDIPWEETVDEDYSIAKAREVMERDHYGIQKVKDRVIEYLAVLRRQQQKGLQAKAQVLCLVGPPGTGKTSVCRSVASALGRPYRRVALGGLHDEAEIRGHRRTYVGAMPGRIMQEIIKAGAANPVFVLDEIDKVQRGSFHGDPSSALLEVLDPEQNCRFHDNFVGIDYDLSRVLFIATANSLHDIQPALLDRMEIIDFSGYVIEEKVEIAKRHLLPRVMHDCGVDRRTLKFSDDMIRFVVDNYTRESGVRQLEKRLSKLVRHRLVQNEMGEKSSAAVSEGEVREVLGLPIHKSDMARKEAREGVVTGLAWTPVGGEILFIESSLSHGKGTITMTGNLGDVMKESATLAFEYIKSNAAALGIDMKQIEESNVHIHVPEGATPKDGPSAGITMFVAMVSVFTHRPVKPNYAMTGEITLRGEVTPIGGVKEKILAAKRAGITDLILCEENRRDVEDIEQAYLEGLTFHYITSMGEALGLVLIDTGRKQSLKPSFRNKKK